MKYLNSKGKQTLNLSNSIEYQTLNLGYPNLGPPTF